MASNVVDKFGYANSIDGRTVGDTTLFVYDTSENYIPLWASFISVSVSGVATVPTVSIGTNAATYDDIMAATPLTGLTSSAVPNFLNVFFSTAKLLPAPGVGTLIKLRVSVASTGVGGSYLFNCNLFGAGPTY